MQNKSGCFYHHALVKRKPSTNVSGNLQPACFLEQTQLLEVYFKLYKEMLKMQSKLLYSNKISDVGHFKQCILKLYQYHKKIPNKKSHDIFCALSNVLDKFFACNLNEFQEKTSNNFYADISSLQLSPILFMSKHSCRTRLKYIWPFWLSMFSSKPDPKECLLLTFLPSIEHTGTNLSVDVLEEVSSKSESSSWNCSDFNDQITEESKSNKIPLDKHSSTLNWLKSTSFYITSLEWSSDESVLFEEAITEDLCCDINFSSISRGSLLCMDDTEDDSEVLFVNDPSSDFTSEYKPLHETDSFQSYENSCFENEPGFFELPRYIKSVNECWQEAMQSVKDRPKDSIKVSFAPEQSLVTVYFFEKTEINSFYDPNTLDRHHFQQRIIDLNHALTPFLTEEHRTKVQLRNNCYQN